jgi:subtilase family serine protease
MSYDLYCNTHRTSYGDDEQTVCFHRSLSHVSCADITLLVGQVPLDYATEVCNLFAQLGARGSSIMFSSGDDGVGGGSCLTNDGTDTEHFQPNFPASCPFVTTVSTFST